MCRILFFIITHTTNHDLKKIYIKIFYNTYILELVILTKSSMESNIKWTPFYSVILPTNPNNGIESSNFFKPKYLNYNFSLLFKWSLLVPVFSINIYNLSFFFKPLGNENALGYLYNKNLSGDSLKI